MSAVQPQSPNPTGELLESAVYKNALKFDGKYFDIVIRTKSKTKPALPHQETIAKLVHASLEGALGDLDLLEVSDLTKAHIIKTSRQTAIVTPGQTYDARSIRIQDEWVQKINALPTIQKSAWATALSAEKTAKLATDILFDLHEDDIIEITFPKARATSPINTSPPAPQKGVFSKAAGVAGTVGSFAKKVFWDYPTAPVRWSWNWAQKRIASRSNSQKDKRKTYRIRMQRVSYDDIVKKPNNPIFGEYKQWIRNHILDAKRPEDLNANVADGQKFWNWLRDELTLSASEYKGNFDPNQPDMWVSKGKFPIPAADVPNAIKRYGIHQALLDLTAFLNLTGTEVNILLTKQDKDHFIDPTQV